MLGIFRTDGEEPVLANITYRDDKLLLEQIACDCGLQHGVPDMDIYIGRSLLERLPEYLRQRQLGSRVVVITDNVVYEVAGRTVVELLRAAGYAVKLCLLERDEPLLPNETALGEVLLTMETDTEFLLSVGSGTLTDIARYVSVCTGKPFACVGTAASMDGYTSVVAPLLHGKQKVNKPAGYPAVLVCDIEIMKTAPLEMMIAGFGDVVGKYIAKADWILGRIVNEEPYCPACVELIDEAVGHCVGAIAGIRAGTEEGIQRLIEGLVLAGLTVLVIGHTRAVASMEHNMGHYWEMLKLQREEDHPSHGTAVGVATGYVLRFYEQFLQADLDHLDLEAIKNQRWTEAQREEAVMQAYGRAVGRKLLDQEDNGLISWEEQVRRIRVLQKNMTAIRSELAFLPSVSEVMAMYDRLGAPQTAAEIGIEGDLLRSSMLYGKDYRNRYSVFNAAWELGLLEQWVDRVLEEQ